MTSITKRLNVAIISGLVAAALATPAMAERGGRGGHDKPGGERSERGNRAEKVFNRIDANEDGVLSLAEMTDPVAAKAEKKLARKDSDEDGMLNAEEMQKNRHGNAVDLSAIGAEIVQCVSDIKETTGNDDIVVPTADSFQSAEDKFNAVDTSGDGLVDLTELTAAMINKANGKFTAMDADVDGSVTLDEFKASHQTHRATKKAVRECVRELTDEGEV